MFYYLFFSQCFYLYRNHFYLGVNCRVYICTWNPSRWVFLQMLLQFLLALEIQCIFSSENCSTFTLIPTKSRDCLCMCTYVSPLFPRLDTVVGPPPRPFSSRVKTFSSPSLHLYYSQARRKQSSQGLGIPRSDLPADCSPTNYNA